MQDRLHQDRIPAATVTDGEQLTAVVSAHEERLAEAALALLYERLNATLDESVRMHLDGDKLVALVLPKTRADWENATVLNLPLAPGPASRLFMDKVTALCSQERVRERLFTPTEKTAFDQQMHDLILSFPEEERPCYAPGEEFDLDTRFLNFITTKYHGDIPFVIAFALPGTSYGRTLPEIT